VKKTKTKLKEWPPKYVEFSLCANFPSNSMGRLALLKTKKEAGIEKLRNRRRKRRLPWPHFEFHRNHYLSRFKATQVSHHPCSGLDKQMPLFNDVDLVSTHSQMIGQGNLNWWPTILQADSEEIWVCHLCLSSSVCLPVALLLSFLLTSSRLRARPWSVMWLSSLWPNTMLVFSHRVHTIFYDCTIVSSLMVLLSDRN
jgi:hypothetical protein